METRSKLAITGGLLLAGLTGAWVLTTPPETVGLLVPQDKAVRELGQSIFAAECAACHGTNLEGQTNWRTRGADGLLPAPPHDASGHTWHHDDRTLFTLTKYGLAGLMENPPPSGMPTYEGVLDDEEIIAVLSYIKSTWPDELRAHHDALNARAE